MSRTDFSLRRIKALNQVWNESVHHPKSSLAPLILVSQWTGTTFFGTINTRRRVLIVFHRLIIISLLALIFVHELPTTHFWVTSFRGLHALLACVETWYRWSILFIIFLINAINNSSVARVISLLVEVPIAVEKSVHATIFRFQILLMVFNSILITGYMVIGHIVWSYKDTKWYTPILYMVTEFYVAFANMQFLGVLFAIRKYFKAVNEQLRNCVSAIDSRNFFFVIDSTYKQDVLSEIVKFRDVHLSLSCICLKLNSCYVGQVLEILLFLVLCMIEITYSLRSIMVYIVTSEQLLEENDWNENPVMEVLLTFFWGGYYIVSLVELVLSCDLTASESRATSVVVHELINKTHDKSIERQLQLFSLQLMNHAASFSAGRFFQLDFTLLHSIIGTITTYLVIIITFRD